MVKKLYVIAVAPHTGAWIETPYSVIFMKSGKSLPIRERGLKHLHSEEHTTTIQSLPIRERGLKHLLATPVTRQRCRSPYGSVD